LNGGFSVRLMDSLSFSMSLTYTDRKEKERDVYSNYEMRGTVSSGLGRLDFLLFARLAIISVLEKAINAKRM